MRIPALLSVAAAATAADVPLLRVTCEGSVELLPDSPMGVTLGVQHWRRAADAAANRLRRRLSCHCPELTDEQFADRYDPVRVVLNLLQGKAEHSEHIGCLDNEATYTRDLHKWLEAQFEGSEITLPESCSRAAYAGGKGCLLQLKTEEEISADLRVAVSQCPGSFVPSMGVWCTGDGCASLLSPCQSGGCGDGQECVDFDKAAGSVLSEGTAVLGRFGDMLGIDPASVWQHLILAVDGDFKSDRTLDDCIPKLNAYPNTIFGKIAAALGGSPTGVCMPKGWDGVAGAAQKYLAKWEEMTGKPREDECAPLVRRKDSQFNWRRGQTTDYGVSGGGWCSTFEECNFHKSAGDCETDDDFEYFMAKLYCRYKQRDGCLEYAPFCYWDTKETDRFKCKFNYTTQKDGIIEGADWMNGLSCANYEEVATQCRAYHQTLPRCEKEYCKCTGGAWSDEDETCVEPEQAPKCAHGVGCWGQLMQCYEKTEKSPFMETPRECELHFQCRCANVAEQLSCDPKSFCGRRCACMHSEKDRFVGPYCDIRLNRGEGPVLFTFNPDEPAPVVAWDGKIAGGGDLVKQLRGTALDHLQPPAPNSEGSTPIAVTSCDGRIWFMPNSPVELSVEIRGLPQLASAVSATAGDLVQCVLGLSEKPDQHFVERSFLPHMPAMWIERFFEGSSDFPQGSLADWLFNATGNRVADVAELQDIVNGAQAQQIFFYPQLREVAAPGWHNYITTHLANAVIGAWSTLTRATRGLGWSRDDKWWYALVDLQNIQRDEERRTKLREILEARQKQLVEIQNMQVGPRWRGTIAAPEGLSSKRWREEGRAGLKIPLPLEGGVLQLHADRCEAGGMAAWQVAVSGPIVDSFLMSKRCTSDADCDIGTCTHIRTRLFESPLYGVDFLSGFLWGGNFTKGFIGKCPILSTTVNSVALATTKDECVGEELWAKDVAATVLTLSPDRDPSEAATCKEEECVLRWCYAEPGDALKGAWDLASEGSAVNFAGAAATDRPPLDVPQAAARAAPPKKAAAKGRSLAELKRMKAAAVDAEDYDEAKRLKELIDRRSREEEL
eukprot:TRINITY_DN643_c0_g3_i1.p1 TRINITY_DN643_c0_g3~~TRINITY_DN643_c0_g3_i1.p1  ORF type:complete len:1064 (+),score=359.30 TRINITY_DN643_c0_g3_i1:80-3271(+)